MDIPVPADFRRRPAEVVPALPGHAFAAGEGPYCHLVHPGGVAEGMAEQRLCQGNDAGGHRLLCADVAGGASQCSGSLVRVAHLLLPFPHDFCAGAHPYAHRPAQGRTVPAVAFHPHDGADSSPVLFPTNGLGKYRDRG